MKFIALFAATCALSATASAAIISIDPLTGVFTDGPLASTPISGFLEIEDNGLASGTADTNPLTTGDGTFVDFGLEFTFFDDELVHFQLFDDLDPLATFAGGQLTGLDYFGQHFQGYFLDVTYDGFQPDVASALQVSFEDASGNISTGTLNLPVNIPEPSTYAAMIGLVCAIMAWRRRRA